MPESIASVLGPGVAHRMREHHGHALIHGSAPTPDGIVPKPQKPTTAVNVAFCPEHGLHGARDQCFECGGDVEQVRMLPMDEGMKAITTDIVGCARCHGDTNSAVPLVVDDAPYVDVFPEVEALLAKVGIDASYVTHLGIAGVLSLPVGGPLIVSMFKGKEGRCQGPMYVVGADVPGASRNAPPDPLPDGWGEPARERVAFRVRT